MKKTTLLLTCIFCFMTFIQSYAQNRPIDDLMEAYQNLETNQGSILDYFTTSEVNEIQIYLQSRTNPIQLNTFRGSLTLAYGTEATALGYGSYSTGAPADFTTISGGSGTADFEGAGAIDPTNNTIGYMVDSGGIMYSFDVLSGVFTNMGSLGVPGGGSLNGLEYDSSGNLYGVDGVNLYSVDPTVPSVSLIGALGGGGLAIALAIDDAGIGYVYDVADDSAYSVNLATGAATLLGAIGFDANFGQGMYYDSLTDTVYLAAFNNTNFLAELRILDRTTGNTTLIGTIAPTVAGGAQLGWSSVLGGPLENFSCEEAVNVRLGITNVEDGIINNSAGASNICFSGATDAIWYKYTAGNSGTLTISSDLAGSAGVDTRVSVYNDDCNALVCIGSDDNSGTDDTSTVDISVVSGTTYYIEWDDANGEAPFDFELSLAISCPDPQNFVVDAVFDTTADFTWTAVAEASNGYVLSVFLAGDDPDTDTPIYTNTIPSGTLADTATGLTGNVTYDAYLTADCDANGFSNAIKITFTTTPANDALCNAIPLTLDETCSGAAYSNVDATTEVGEPEGDCFNGGAQSTVWFSFVAPANGRVLITTDIEPATNADTEIAVYAAPTDCADASTLGAALGCDQDSGEVIIFNSILELDETVLTPGETYYIQVSGYAGTVGTFCIEVYTGPDCPPVENFTVSNVTTETADFSWDVIADASSGYILSVFDAGADPLTDTPVYTENVASGTLSTTASGLVADSAYDAYITADCGALGTSSEMTMLSFSTSPLPPQCGGQFTDSGGTAAGYGNSEDITTTIVPDNSGDAVTITFTYVDIETATATGTIGGCWDYMSIYNGPTTTSPVLAQTLCGEQSGDGGVPSVAANLLSVGDAFTSTDASGALTIRFRSDSSVPETGWIADVTCAVLSIDDVVSAGFNYYPNPTSNILYAKAQQPIETVSLFNMLGQEVLTLRPNALNMTLNMSELSNGTYVMKSTINGNTFTHKVIKK
ncbi:MAG: T9SS type A sorting domain-containing protein [Aquaticitalea sp.]